MEKRLNKYYEGSACNTNSTIILQKRLSTKQYILETSDVGSSKAKSRHSSVQICLLWKAGSFHQSSGTSKIFPHFYNEDILLAGSDPLLTSYSTNFAWDRGRWSNTNQSLPWLSFLGMRKWLERSHIIFQGDSMIRQMFNRLVHHLRGFDVVIEHFHHFSARYSCNSTSDLLIIGCNHLKSPETVLNPSVLIDYVWDPTLDDNKVFQSTLQARNTLFVVGLLHWLRSQPAIDKLQKYVSPHTIFVTVPTLNTPDEGSLKILRARNDWIRLHSTRYIPLNEMTEDGKSFQTNENDPYHFQCAYLGASNRWIGWLEPVAILDNQAHYKSPRTGDCRDLVNLNIAMIIAYHYHHFHA